MTSVDMDTLTFGTESGSAVIPGPELMRTFFEVD